MSQIDKAFLSAYSKKRSAPAIVVDSRPIVDPIGERQLKVHGQTPPEAILQPHVPSIALTAKPDVAIKPPSIPAKQVQVAIKKSATVEPVERQPLTNYLKKIRESTESVSLPTRWSVGAAIAQPKPIPKLTTPKLESAKSIPATPQHRIDAPHRPQSPVQRPASTIPWQFGTVERSIKATADSKSIAARTANAIEKPEPIATRTANAIERPEPIATHAHSMPQETRSRVESVVKIALPIQAAWEIDEFQWPSATANLISTQAEAFHEIGLHLQQAQGKGLRVLSVSSGERGVGRSTVAMCLARIMSIVGLRIGLIDGDYECPSLVDQFNLDIQHGWQQCLFENVPLEEAAIHSVNESITLFPLTDSIATSQIAAHGNRINKLIKRIVGAYDMVIIDANRLTQKQSQLIGTGEDAVLDALLMITDAELSLRQRVDSAIELARLQGIQSIGLVENFHS